MALLMQNQPSFDELNELVNTTTLDFGGHDTSQSNSCKISILNGKGKKKCTQIEIPLISLLDAKKIQKAISMKCGLRGSLCKIEEKNIIVVGGKDIDRVGKVLESFGYVEHVIEDLSRD